MKDKKTPATRIESPKRDKQVFLLLVIVSVLGLFATYWNHFDNSFHFDDAHTIVQNVYIRDIKANYKKYFTDAKTLTPLPANQSYRPIVTLSYGFDYWLSSRLGRHTGEKMQQLENQGKIATPEYQELLKADASAESKYVARKGDPPKPFIFHCSNFLWFLVQGFLMFFFIVRIFDITAPHRFNRFFVLFATAFYMYHTVIAETINYICARSDSYSTMLVILSFVMYQYWSIARKFFLFLLPMVISILIKPTGLMFAPLLILYIVLIEQQIGITDIFKGSTYRKLLNLQVIAAIIIPMGIAVAGYIYITGKTPDTFVPSNTSKHDYIITQPYVFLKYVEAFFAPVELSADSDLKAFESTKDPRFAIGLSFVLALLALGIFCTKNKSLRPIAYGIFWFFLALLPSSSIIPFAEVINDHRMYFPFVGLVISFVWALALLYRKFEKTILQSAVLRVALPTLCVLTISGFAYGTVQRNIVWNDDESLWLDVTIKSPKNGRGLMNYGLTQYSKSYKELNNGNKEKALYYVNRALEYYNKALQYTPNYAYLHVNMALTYDMLGKLEGNPQKYYNTVESFFKRGQYNSGGYYGAYHYYAGWLHSNKRLKDAIWNEEQALKYGPEYDFVYTTLMSYYLEDYQWEKIRDVANQMLLKFPGNQYANYYLQISQNRKSRIEELQDLAKANPTVDNYINLSLAYYNKQMYNECIAACNEALKINPNSASAYNNICTAYNMLGNYDKAIDAGNKALQLDPNNTLAKGNLDFAVKSKKTQSELLSNPTAEGYLNTGLNYHRQQNYSKAIEFYEKALTLNPNYGLAYNNICSAYNDMGQYTKAVPYGEKAVKLEPSNQLFGNNLKIARNKGHL